ncbi:phage holin family protein [Sinorhizobium meliloti]|uniref:phage holin family protein n=1 Tax=Rhizobium meliloti TaxID=382 RepID=UPI001F16A1E1
MRRKFFGKELLWGMPIAVGMAFIGEALALWLALEQPMATGLIAALAYLGPRGSEVLFMVRGEGGEGLKEERGCASG